MESNKSFAWPGYLLAFLLVAVPLFDSTISVLPMRLADEKWRFGAVGAFSNVTLVPLLGILLALFLANTLDQRRVRRVIGWLCILFALILAGASVVFVLDYFQTKVQVRPQFQTAIGIATTTAIVKQVFTILMLALLARTGLAGPRVLSRKGPVPAPEQTGATPLIPLGGGARPE